MNKTQHGHTRIFNRGILAITGSCDDHRQIFHSAGTYLYPRQGLISKHRPIRRATARHPAHIRRRLPHEARRATTPYAVCAGTPILIGGSPTFERQCQRP